MTIITFLSKALRALNEKLSKCWTTWKHIYCIIFTKKREDRVTTASQCYLSRICAQASQRCSRGSASEVIDFFSRPHLAHQEQPCKKKDAKITA